jgi:hypothetical protein
MATPPGAVVLDIKRDANRSERREAVRIALRLGVDAGVIRAVLKFNRHRERRHASTLARVWVLRFLNADLERVMDGAPRRATGAPDERDR